MKKSLLAAGALMFTCIATAQDTTNLLLAGLNVDDGNVTFYDQDTLQFTAGNTFNTYSVMGLFQNPSDSNMLALMDLMDDGDRDFYYLDPLTGSTTMYFETSQDYYASADISDSGFIYAITGNAHNNPGAVYKIDPANNTENFLFQSGAQNNISRVLEYNPADHSLYIYQEGTGSLEVRSLTSNTSSFVAVQNINSEVHGAFFNPHNQELILTSYGSDHMVLQSPYTSPYKTITSNIATMDIANVDFVSSSADSISLCTSDSALLTYRYGQTTNLVWLKDGILFATNTSSIYVSTAGIYHALYEVEAGKYLKSEPIVIENFSTPVVTITEANGLTEICPNNNEVLTLTGANGGSLQWFRNGVAITGETTNTYSATQAGVYNQLKTNMSECSDSSAISYVINLTAGCTNTIHVEEVEETTLTLYPNPITGEVINIESVNPVQQIKIYDLKGVLIYQENGEHINSVNFSPFNRGVYVLEITTSAQQVIQRKVQY